MSTLYEKFISSLQLTEHQRKVLAEIAGAPTPKIAAANISEGRNTVAARDMLISMGMIEFKEDEYAALTSKGTELAKAEDIIDEAGTLTDTGQQLLSVEESFTLIKGILKKIQD